MIKRVRGTQDILPSNCGQAGQDSSFWQEIEQVARRIFTLYDYQEIRTPIIEEASLFNRSLGETTDIVQKQMFQIRHDKDNLVLRPEATVSVVRAYLENNLDKKKKTAKFYYLGPMFRAERPQKGRLRQFHHLGIEALGSLSPQLDVEVISLSCKLLEELGIKDFRVELNSLGCAKDKQALSKLLREKIQPKASGLCEDCQKRLKRNVFRILDCKKSACKQLVSSLNLRHDYLCSECSTHLREVLTGLDAIGLKYQLSFSLVRGLDYYTRTVFEIKHNALGAQDALGAGGRYDNLVEELAGPKCGAIGFALGIERLLLARQKNSAVGGLKNLVYVIRLGEEANKKSAQLLHNLRSNNICADMDYTSRSLKAQMRLANDSGARLCIIIGDDELKNKTFSLKDMKTSLQRSVPEVDLLKELNLILTP